MKRIWLLMLCLIPLNVMAEGWCSFDPGWQVISHGNLDNKTWINGKINGVGHWIEIGNNDGTVGKNNIAIAIAAQLANKTISIYLDPAADTCDNIPVWYSNVRHIKMQ